MEKSIKALLEGIIVGVINTFLFMVLFFIPVLNILAVLFPIPLVVVGVRRGPISAIIGLAISSILMGFIIHPYFGVMIFCLNIFIILSLLFVYNKNLDMSESIILSSGGTLLSILVSLQIFTWMTNESFFDYIWTSLKTFFNSNSINITGLMELYQSLGIIDKTYSADGFVEMLMGQMKDLAPIFPSTLLLSSLMIGGLSFLVSRFLLKKLKVHIPDIPPFRRWSLPRGTGRGFMGLILIAIIGTWIRIPNFEVVLYTISSVFSFIFTVQGLSVVSFFLAEKRVPGIVMVLILIGTFIFLLLALTFLGIFEQMFGIRRAYENRKLD